MHIVSRTSTACTNSRAPAPPMRPKQVYILHVGIQCMQATGRSVILYALDPYTVVAA